MVRRETRQVVVGVLLVALFWFVSIQMAYATGNRGDQLEQEQHQGQDQHQGQEQGQEANAAADASASMEGVENSTSVSTESNNTNVVLVPNNNTESCLRVWGISFGTHDGAGALGIPWRSSKCDFEQAADDAFAAGERELGWFWKCQNSNLAKRFKLDGMSMDEARHECHRKAVGITDAYKTIDTLREQLEYEREERMIERDNARESRERLELACEESKDRILSGCVRK